MNGNGKDWLVRGLFGLLGLSGGAFSTALWVKGEVAENATDIAVNRTEIFHVNETLRRIELKLDKALEEKP